MAQVLSGGAHIVSSRPPESCLATSAEVRLPSLFKASREGNRVRYALGWGRGRGLLPVTVEPWAASASRITVRGSRPTWFVFGFYFGGGMFGWPFADPAWRHLAELRMAGQLAFLVLFLADLLTTAWIALRVRAAVTG